MSRKGTRITVERGIYRDATGYEVVARAGKVAKSRRYGVNESFNTMRAWRDATASDLRDEAQPTTDPSSLAGAIEKYRKAVKLPTDHAYQPSLNAWIRLYGPLERRKLTPALASQALDQWKHEGYSPQSLYYRRLVLEKLWKALDGPKVKTPVDDLSVIRPKNRRPQTVDDDTIYEVLSTLRRQELAGRLRSPKTRARLLVLVTTGQRPAQMKRATRRDVDLERKVWHVSAAKGGEAIPLPLNSEMIDAWKAFIKADAWGEYDTRSFARVIRRAGWPVGLRIYNARHATGYALSARGADLGDIQLALGHTDPSTTRVYVGAIESRLRAVSDALEGRFRR